MKKTSTEKSKGDTQQQQTTKTITISTIELRTLEENVDDYAINAEKPQLPSPATHNRVI